MPMKLMLHCHVTNKQIFFVSERVNIYIYRLIFTENLNEIFNVYVCL
jgi:hypothetical protein